MKTWLVTFVNSADGLSEIEVQAETDIGARREAKRKLGKELYRFTSVYEIKKPIDNELNLEFDEPTDNVRETCEDCGTPLTDGGYCPVCDDGEEDLKETVNHSGSVWHDVRSMINRRANSWDKGERPPILWGPGSYGEVEYLFTFCLPGQKPQTITLNARDDEAAEELAIKQLLMRAMGDWSFRGITKLADIDIEKLMRQDEIIPVELSKKEDNKILYKNDVLALV